MNIDQPFDWWSIEGGPMGIVDAVTLPDLSNHYTTRTGDDKTKIPKYRTIENTDKGTV